MDSNGVITFADEYQDRTKETEIYTAASERFIDDLETFFTNSGVGGKPILARDFLSLMYCTGKLNGEAGEIAEAVFKAFRGDNGRLTGELQDSLLKELGDVMWYVARIADIIGYRLSDVMTENIKKLADRKERGVIHGNGDER